MDWKESLDYFEKLVAQFPEMERKGKTMPYTSVNGHMFSFLDKEGRMSLRLNKGDREDFLEKYDSCLSEQHGRIMKEYVLVPESLLQNTDQLKEYMHLSHQYTLGLKPKPTKRKK
ncbi:MAG: hypothetical protein AB3N16_00405 [Flavobacteriaceae bacterium]